MESKQDIDQGVSGGDINIDINGPDTSTAQVGSSTMKNMSPDEGARVGLTKDELLKYANEPFWIRLRNVLFATFWIVWVSILIAAIGYVVQSPGCSSSLASAASVTAAPAAGASSS